MKRQIFGILLLSLLCFLLNRPAQARPLIADNQEVLYVLESIPVQHGGRIKPFKSFAQETVLYITGRNRWEKTDPTALVFSWFAFPQAWSQEAFLKVSFEELQKELGPKVINGKISAANVLGDRNLTEKAKRLSALKDKGEKLQPLEEKTLDLYSRASYLDALLRLVTPGFFAIPQDKNNDWAPLADLFYEERAAFYNTASVKEAVVKLKELIRGLRENPDDVALADKAQAFAAALNTLNDASGMTLDRGMVQKELLYQRLRPFHLAWLCYLAAFGLLMVSSAVTKKFAGTPAEHFLVWSGFGVFLAAVLIHTFGIYLRIVIAGRPPVSNMYESLIWVSWVVAFFALIYFLSTRKAFLITNASFVAGLVLLLAGNFPVVFSPAIDTLVPVLRSNLWLTVHVLTITMSYGAFALTWGIGHGLMIKAVFGKNKVQMQDEEVRSLHRILMIGVALLAAGTILGGVWANYSWGRFWGWDPKETWALIALLGYLAVLHGRFAGWLSAFGLVAGSVAAFLGVVMAWYGVNYVLAAGLHSYGFGGGGASYVLLVALLDLGFVGFCVWRYRSRVKSLSTFK